MSKARDLAYFNFPAFSGATLDLANNTLVSTLAQLNAAITDADVASAQDVVDSNTSISNQTSLLLISQGVI